MAKKKRPKETKKVRKVVTNDQMANVDVEFPDEDELDPEDFEYFQDMRNFAFIQGIATG